MHEDIDKYIKGFLRAMPSEDMFMDAIHDIVKDLVKEMIRKKINDDPKLKSDLAEMMMEFFESKVKEYDSMAKMAKITAKIGLISAPDSIKDEAMKDIMDTFRREIQEIILRTL
ncbi:MAG: nitrite reductase [Thermoplasmataceae archaeon]